LLLRYARKVRPGLSAQTKERAVFGRKTRTRSSLDDGLSIVYTEAEIRRPRPFSPSKLSDVLEARFVPIISVKILLHILVKSRKKIICQLRKKNLVFVFHEILGSFNQYKLKVLFFISREAKCFGKKRMISFLIVLLNHFFLSYQMDCGDL